MYNVQCAMCNVQCAMYNVQLFEDYVIKNIQNIKMYSNFY